MARHRAPSRPKTGLRMGAQACPRGRAREIMIRRDASKPRRGTTVATEDIRERLAQLPHHAVVAFAARCARRVQPLTHALPQQGRDAIDRALASAEAFAKGADAARAAA